MSRQVAAKAEAFQKMSKKGDLLLFVRPYQPIPACDESRSVAPPPAAAAGPLWGAPALPWLGKIRAPFRVGPGINPSVAGSPSRQSVRARPKSLCHRAEWHDSPATGLTVMANNDVDGGAAPDLPARGRELFERPSGRLEPMIAPARPGGRPRKSGDERHSLCAAHRLPLAKANLRTGC